ncbi:isoprenoid synthase domain-containing protein [Mycena belliarum]|uniref:Isoprenoid synthase domain-containing protein n=1 Tax=Mycena belliarum TaxID=1033014 RepID=A0AAD6U1Y7_9AGAR|nr:isoprenoid synthase domain-containing protein [Mycena belliae]
MTIEKIPKDTGGKVQTQDLEIIIKSLLDVVSYQPPDRTPNDSTEALEKDVGSIVESWNADPSGENRAVFDSISKKAVSVVEFFYSQHTFETKLVFAMYAWFFFYIDDNAGKPFLEDFQRRIMLGYPQEDPPLQNLHQVLGNLYNHWDPISANSMVSAAQEFISGTALEVRKEVSEMKIQPTASSWAKYLRAKSGMAPGFSCAAFPKQTHPDLSAYIQVLPDIDDYLCLVNDILSFYKEELAGETMTYVHMRCKTTGKHAAQVLMEMVEEVGDLHGRISATLEGHSEASKAWDVLENGFIAWHLSIKRYKLVELGFH